jgi:acyl carrier protein
MHTETNSIASAALSEGSSEFDVEVLTKLRSWIAEKTGDSPEIGLDVDLIDDGVLDSLKMVNFLLYVEELRGHEIAEALIQPRYFKSLRVILTTFFES